MAIGCNANLPQNVVDAMGHVARLQEELRLCRPGKAEGVKTELCRNLEVLQAYHASAARDAQMKIDKLRGRH
jgi:hypothetical protein